MTTLRLGYFSRSPVLALAEANGLAIAAEPVASSPAQFAALSAGSYDLILTSPDNLAAHPELDVRIVRAVDGGMGLSLLGAPGVRDLDDLRGGVIGVDVPHSGFAFALYELLASHGLHRNADYDVVALGATPKRAVALRAGRCHATLLNGGLVLTAQRDGLANLGRVTDVVRPYLGTVLAASGRWLDEHPELVRQFTRSWQRAVTQLLGAGEEIDPLLADVFRLPQAQLPAIRDVLHDPSEGLVPDGEVDPAALANVALLRARYGRKGAPCGSP
ncbi:MAG TPA: PhnD/SsuA/transferrin family substrate-binding protein [Pseudonocardiaceae bacterium]|nr:PhnD/SsuA/transferrin family substrate-binding protein [Pseudonocardiaceae bacterium]